MSLGLQGWLLKPGGGGRARLQGALRPRCKTSGAARARARAARAQARRSTSRRTSRARRPTARSRSRRAAAPPHAATPPRRARDRARARRRARAARARSRSLAPSCPARALGGSLPLKRPIEARRDQILTDSRGRAAAVSAAGGRRARASSRWTRRRSPSNRPRQPRRRPLAAARARHRGERERASGGGARAHQAPRARARAEGARSRWTRELGARVAADDRAGAPLSEAARELASRRALPSRSLSAKGARRHTPRQRRVGRGPGAAPEAAAEEPRAGAAALVGRRGRGAARGRARGGRRAPAQGRVAAAAARVARSSSVGPRVARRV